MKGFKIWNVFLPSWCWRHGRVFSNLVSGGAGEARVRGILILPSQPHPTSVPPGVLWVVFMFSVLRPGLFPPLTSLLPPLPLLPLLLIRAMYNQHLRCCQNRRSGNWAVPGGVGGGGEDTWANAFLCLRNVITCISYIFGFIVGNVTRWADTPTGLRFHLAHLFPLLLYY